MRKPLILAAATLGLIVVSALHAQVQQVIDTRQPLKGVTTVTPPNWDELPPVFLGDVNGDGFEDYGLLWLDPESEVDNTFLVYGSPDQPIQVAMESLPHTLLKHGDRDQGGIWAAGCIKHLAAVGDVDADGFGDFLFGGCRTSWQGVEHSGAALLIFGSPELPAELDLTTLASTGAAGGVRSVLFLSEEEGISFANVVEQAGDMNGDGLVDYALSASWAGPGTEGGDRGAGRVYVVYGSSDPPHEIRASEIGRSVPGFVFLGAYGDDRAGGHPEGDSLGEAVAPAGDVNGDGFDDLLVGAESATRLGRQQCGAAYLVYGGPAIPAEISNIELDGIGVEFLGGRTFAGLGIRVSRVGDVDRDGLDDLLLSGAVGDPGNEEVFLIYGSKDLPKTVVLDGSESIRRFRLRASPMAGFLLKNSFLGLGLGGVGDVNSDGFPDFVCGAPHESRDHDPSVGAAYLIFGSPVLPREAMDEDIGTDRLRGIRILGDQTYSYFGAVVSPQAGDVDGDGERDFFITTDWHGVRSIEPERHAIYLFRRGATLPQDLGLSGVEPSLGSIDGGIEVHIFGRGFTGTERVLFGGAQSPRTTTVHSSELRAMLPPRPETGLVDVVIDSGQARVKLEAVSSTLTRASSRTSAWTRLVSPQAHSVPSSMSSTCRPSRILRALSPRQDSATSTATESMT